LGDNTTEIKHRISQTRKTINALNSIWWHKNKTKNRKLYIYQTIIQSILVYGAEVWQIPTREINKILSTEITTTVYTYTLYFCKFNTTGMFHLKISNYCNPYVILIISTLSVRRDKKKYDITNTWEM
jgi:hypothetical protein